MGFGETEEKNEKREEEEGGEGTDMWAPIIFLFSDLLNDVIHMWQTHHMKPGRKGQGG